MDKNTIYQFTQINSSPTIVENAGAAIDDVRCRLVKYDEAGDVVLCAAGDAPLGVAIITNAAAHAKGDAVTIQIKDNGLVMAGDTFAKGDLLAADASGKAVKATAGNATIGIALEAAKAADDVVRFILTRGIVASGT